MLSTRSSRPRASSPTWPPKKSPAKTSRKCPSREFLRASREPYRRLLGYLRPYRGRFLLGMLFGALFGVGQWRADPAHPRAWCRSFFPTARRRRSKLAERGFRFSSRRLNPAQRGAVGSGAICATIPALMAVRGLFSYLNAYCMLWVSQRVLDDIRQPLFRHMLGQSLEFFNRAESRRTRADGLQPDARGAAGADADRGRHREAADRHPLRARRAASPSTRASRCWPSPSSRSACCRC